ncbi:DUF2252 family protein [Acetobacter malorum]|uniref:DUF2252 family protein n=1 Tax=Acetobacter malorum TaxID=178901 RepID=UPI00248E9263|nr:DUF2252 family protein [Acetobacter malorum]
MPISLKLFYIRRLKGPRLATIGAEFSWIGLPEHDLLCGRTLARAHARSGDVATLSGYLGAGRAFADAIATFSTAYATRPKPTGKRFVRRLRRDRFLRRFLRLQRRPQLYSRKNLNFSDSIL